MNYSDFIERLQRKSKEVKALIESRDANAIHWKCFDAFEQWTDSVAENLETLEELTTRLEEMLEKLPAV